MSLGVTIICVRKMAPAWDREHSRRFNVLLVLSTNDDDKCYRV